jgi:hypothetical protein
MTHGIQHNNKYVVLRVRIKNNFGECNYADCHYTDGHNVECHYTECRGASPTLPPECNVCE